MIDERTHSGMLAMRAGGGGGASLGGRMGDSMPDYDNVKVSWLCKSEAGPRQLRGQLVKVLGNEKMCFLVRWAERFEYLSKNLTIS